MLEKFTLFEGAGAVGWKNWQARWARQQAEAWVGNIIAGVRTHQRAAPSDRALHVISWHRDQTGALLDQQVAAVELLNVLRPVVAIAHFIVFAALALHAYPHCRKKIEAGQAGYLECFVQEVRRFYPFFPFAAACVRHSFIWRGYHFPQGTRVLLDLYGTNHDARSWTQPDEFQPERFYGWKPNAFDFIPQGGGDYYINHRCAGEWITIEVMKAAIDLLAKAMTYEVPPQNLRFRFFDFPAIPRSHFVMSQVRRTAAFISEGYPA